MVRVVSTGGTVAAYAWDMPGGGFPLQPIQSEMFAMGYPPLRPPSAHVSSAEALKTLWTDAGLEGVETRRIDVKRTFTDFDDFWSVAMLAPSTGPTVASMPPDDVELLKKRVRARLPADASGRITFGAWANAVRGSVPA